jgi:hypothetical protein
MRLLLSSALLGLAWFAATNLVVSALIWLIAPGILRRGTAGPGVLLLLRLLPAAAATLLTLVFLSGHLRYEPRNVEESFGSLLIGLALLATALTVRSGQRLGSVARSSLLLRRLAGPAHAAPSEVLEIEESTAVSLAGIFRTRILVGSTVRAALTPAELDVAIAHERAHRRSRDNVKRCAIFCAPDVFGWSARARHLEARWRAEAECRADARAVGGDEARALHLASALVKVAKLGQAPRSPLRSTVWSTFHEAPLLDARVRRLVGGGAVPCGEFRWTGGAGALALTLPVMLWLTDASHNLHLLTELLIASLP